MDKLVRQTKEYAGNIVLAIGGAKCFVSNFLLNLNVRASYQLWCIKSRPSPIRGTLSAMSILPASPLIVGKRMLGSASGGSKMYPALNSGFVQERIIGEN